MNVMEGKNPKNKQSRKRKRGKPNQDNGKTKHQQNKKRKEEEEEAVELMANEDDLNNMDIRNRKKKPQNMMNLNEEILKEQARRFENRNQRCLSVRLPVGSNLKTLDDLKAFFENAVRVRVQRQGLRIVEYATKQMAQKMKKKLDEKEIDGGKLEVIFTGGKSKNPRKSYSPKKLFVDGLPDGTTIEELAAIFNTAKYIQRKIYDDSSAFLLYTSHVAALKAFNEHKNLKIKDLEVVVAFSSHNMQRHEKEKKLKTINVQNVLNGKNEESKEESDVDEEDEEDE